MTAVPAVTAGLCQLRGLGDLGMGSGVGGLLSKLAATSDEVLTLWTEPFAGAGQVGLKLDPRCLELFPNILSYCGLVGQSLE